MRARWTTLWEVPQALEFAIANAVKGNLDSRIYTYPTLRIMRSENGTGEALAYLPVHNAVILESVGWAPDISAAQKTAAVVTAATEVEREAYLLGIREVFFVSSDERIDEFAVKHLAWEKVTTLRKRLLP